MRNIMFALPLLLCATPAVAQSAPPSPGTFAIPPELTNPATADRLAGMMQGLSKAFLDMRVGEIQAAAEGRAATPAEKRMTVRDMARRDDPDFDRKFARQIAQSGPMIHQGVKALSDALPAVMQGLSQAQQALERAASNLPDPNYPKR